MDPALLAHIKENYSVHLLGSILAEENPHPEERGNDTNDVQTTILLDEHTHLGEMDLLSRWVIARAIEQKLKITFADSVVDNAHTLGELVDIAMGMSQPHSENIGFRSGSEV